MTSGPPRTTYLVKQAELVIRAELDRIVRLEGLTTPQYTALSVLARHPGLSSAQLARRSFVTAQAANEMVGALERKGFVARSADATNRRVLEMRLTDRGRSALERCDVEVDQLEERMLAGMDAAAREALRRALEACVRALAPGGGRT